MDTRELCWLAGLFEGEAYFGAHDRNTVITFDTTDLDVLLRAREIVGGESTVFERAPHGLGKKPSFRFNVNSNRAVGWMMTLYPLLGSRRREQVRGALERWRARQPLNARKRECKHGHPFDEENTYQYRPNHRMCKTCARERDRLYRTRMRSAVA